MRINGQLGIDNPLAVSPLARCPRMNRPTMSVHELRTRFPRMKLKIELEQAVEDQSDENARDEYECWIGEDFQETLGNAVSRETDIECNRGSV